MSKIDLLEPLFIDNDSPNLDSLPSPCRSTRPDNTLRALTQRFVELIQNAPGQTIEIDEASQRLNIQKRRIYDITNVLQGIGYIEKLGKNLMKWVGGVQGQQLEQEAAQLDRRTAAIDRKTAEVEEQIATLKRLLQDQTRTNHAQSFLQMNDLESFMRENQLQRMLVYAGGVGDQMTLDANPETKCTQCTIEDRTGTARLLFCRFYGEKLEVKMGKKAEEKEQDQEEEKYEEEQEDEEEQKYEQDEKQAKQDKDLLKGERAPEGNNEEEAKEN